MANVVWKYELKPLDANQSEPFCVGMFDMPPRAQILTAQYQGDDVVLWASVNKDYIGKGNCRVDVYCVGTGWGSVPERSYYLTTIQRHEYVWHIFYTINIS